MPTPVLADSIIGETALMHSTDHGLTRALSLIAACATPSLKAVFVVNVALITLDVALCQAVIALCVWCLFARNRVSLYTVALSSIFFKGMVHPSFTKSLTIIALVSTSGFIDHSALEGFFRVSMRNGKHSSSISAFILVIPSLRIATALNHRSFIDWLDMNIVYKAASSSVQPLSLSAMRYSSTFDLHLRRFTAWLLNHAELSRVQKTMGNREDEISSEAVLATQNSP
ncbi:uncharacterized protein HD556DRAFT_1306845 [Suillus plorans]|uniref:Uncharacterized protein n=1 Tax=Suillus plorans TaxID=116603 RepID=A0A9P7AYN1_9AGAM|nr:uncharacterized protein HD556DRAFT_1306845 [Suillus plorans]KAG1796647.1 hypothetical protein HD556DRAFT_1306845 [Suillus plorans]